MLFRFAVRQQRLLFFRVHQRNLGCYVLDERVAEHECLHGEATEQTTEREGGLESAGVQAGVGTYV